MWEQHVAWVINSKFGKHQTVKEFAWFHYETKVSKLTADNITQLAEARRQNKRGTINKITLASSRN